MLYEDALKTFKEGKSSTYQANKDKTIKSFVDKFGAKYKDEVNFSEDKGKPVLRINGIPGVFVFANDNDFYHFDDVESIPETIQNGQSGSINNLFDLGQFVPQLPENLTKNVAQQETAVATGKLGNADFPVSKPVSAAKSTSNE